MARKRIGPLVGKASAPTEAKARIQTEQDYRAEDDVRTLERAEEVRADAGRHARAQGHARKKLTSMARIAFASKMSKGRMKKRTMAGSGARR